MSILIYLDTLQNVQKIFKSSEVNNKYTIEDLFDIIIEDADVLKDQIISFYDIYLKPGGLFICEELDFPEKRKI